MFLEIKDLSIKYQDFTAVKHFDLSLEEGTFACLLGPSGCGKTTLLRALGGFVKQASGKIYLAGEELTQPPEERPIATVFQSYALFPHMTVGANICYGLRLRKVPRERQAELLQDMLTRVDLEGYADKRVHELSGGEQQRVALARSLIIQPRLLLLDEPLSNLDAKLRVSLRSELKQIQEDFAITTIMVTHDQDEAFELADHLVLMHAGEKVEEGRGQELYSRPQAAFTREFLGESSYYPEKSPERPEAWRFLKPHEKPAPGQLALDAVVEHCIFQGAVIYYDCRLITEDSRLRLMEINSPEAYRPPVGSQVTIIKRQGETA